MQKVKTLVKEPLELFKSLIFIHPKCALVFGCSVITLYLQVSH